MTGKDLLAGISNINGKFIEEAENCGLPQTKQTAPVRKRGTVKKALLIAAVIAMTVLLVGCAVVYVLSMQDLKVGDTTETQPVLATDGISIIGYEDVNYQVLTLAGMKGTPSYQAALEWYAFKQEYDPDHLIYLEVKGKAAFPEFPEEYASYNLYTQEMKDRLDEILATYDLKPAGAALDFRTLKNMCAALGVERIQTADNDVSIKVNSGGCRENGNFSLYMDIGLPEDGENQINATTGSLLWNRKDCFSGALITIADTGDWQEWNYTTTSGSNVLILRSPSDWRGWILCDRGEAILSLQVEARADIGNNVDGKTWWDYLYLTDRQMEQIADAIDFGIQPRVATREDVANQPAASNAVTQNGYTVELKSVETDGWVARITMHITAPEGTIISHNPREGFANQSYSVKPGNFNNFNPVEGRDVGGSGAWNPQEDNDGLDNTQDIVLIARRTMEDGSAPFGPGKVWKVRFEDLEFSYWDSGNSTSVEEILAEGEWEFEITFGEENGDYREIELLREPVATKAAGGFYPDGRDAEEDVEITSFKLRKFSTSIEHNGEDYLDFTWMNGKCMCAVMKDGSCIEIGGILYTPIDLDQVDYVQLVDGTKLTVPEGAIP